MKGLERSIAFRQKITKACRFIKIEAVLQVFRQCAVNREKKKMELVF